MTEEKKQSLHPISEILCRVYRNLYERQEVFFVLQDEQIEKLDTIVKTVYGTWFGVNRFPANEDKAVVFFCLIIKDHPVIDGNKRMAVLWLQIFCETYELKMNPKIPLDVLAVSVEQTKEMDNDQLFAIIKTVLFSTLNE